MPQRQVSKHNSKVTPDPDVDWDSDYYSTITEINPKPQDLEQVIRDIGANCGEVLLNTVLKAVVGYSAARLFDLVLRHPEEVRNSSGELVLRRQDADGKPSCLIADFGDLRLVCDLPRSRYLEVVWHRQAVSSDGTVVCTFRPMVRESLDGDISIEPGPWIHHMESIRRELASRFGEDMELPHLDIERWRGLSENIDQIRNCIDKFCGIESMQHDPMESEHIGFRLEWEEADKPSKHHCADYDTLSDAEAAQLRLRRMARIIASIRPIAMGERQ